MTVTNFETPHPTGQLVQSAGAATVMGFGYAFLAAALLTAIGIIFAGSLKRDIHRQAEIVEATTSVVIGIVISYVANLAPGGTIVLPTIFVLLGTIGAKSVTKGIKMRRDIKMLDLH